MNRSAPHTALVRSILAACGSRPDCRLWANATGVGRSMDSDRTIRFGLPGSSDILGIYRSGKLLAIECKTGSARQSKEQLAFQDMVSKFGGYYYVARDVADVQDWLDGMAAAI